MEGFIILNLCLKIVFIIKYHKYRFIDVTNAFIQLARCLKNSMISK